MRQYFEYATRRTQEELYHFYSQPGLEQHGGVQARKSSLKLARLEQSVNFSRSDKVLDVGCGPGNVLKKLSNRIGEGVGVDITLPVAADDERYSNLRFEKIDNGSRLPFNDEMFNKVLLLDVLEHVLDPVAVLEECKRVMASNGKMIIEVPFTGSISEALAGEFHQGHLRYYDPEYLRQWLMDAQLEVISIRTYNSVPLSGLWLRYPYLHTAASFCFNLVPSSIYPWFGEIIAVCERSTK